MQRSINCPVLTGEQLYLKAWGGDHPVHFIHRQAFYKLDGGKKGTRYLWVLTHEKGYIKVCKSTAIFNQAFTVEKASGTNIPYLGIRVSMVSDANNIKYYRETEIPMSYCRVTLNNYTLPDNSQAFHTVDAIALQQACMLGLMSLVVEVPFTLVSTVANTLSSVLPLLARRQYHLLFIPKEDTQGPTLKGYMEARGVKYNYNHVVTTLNGKEGDKFNELAEVYNCVDILLDDDFIDETTTSVKVYLNDMCTVQKIKGDMVSLKINESEKQIPSIHKDLVFSSHAVVFFI